MTKLIETPKLIERNKEWVAVRGDDELWVGTRADCLAVIFGWIVQAKREMADEYYACERALSDALREYR